MESSKSIKLQADDSKLLRVLIDEGDKEGLGNFLTQTGVSVNTTSILNHKDEKAFPLHVAVNVPPDKCHFNTVMYFLSERAECNITDGDGQSPLHYSVFRNNIDATKALLDAGANVNLQTDPPFPSLEGDLWACEKARIINRWCEKKTYPLHLAVKAKSKTHLAFPQNAGTSGVVDCNVSHCEHQEYDLIKLLLSHGADCNLIDGSHLAPLHYAVSQNDECLVTLLLEAGADINIRSPERQEIPLFYVSHVSMLKFLLSRNADPRIQAWNTTTVLYASIVNRRSDLTRYLISDTDLRFLDRDLLFHMRSSSSKSPLVHRNNAETVHLLLSAGHNNSPKVLKSVLTEKDEELIKEITEIASNPRPLADLCTFRIRQVLQININTAVHSLPLPAKLKDRITLAHVHVS